ncbi:MAG: hypothetical protein GWP06_16800 [Actinobacteria bacterium]|nr:hypothetical protein [Actinomycetota bacterium]
MCDTQNEVLDAGSYEITWDGRDRNGSYLPDGIYIVRMTAGGERIFRRLVITR